jgi:hypothetical protein
VPTPSSILTRLVALAFVLPTACAPEETPVAPDAAVDAAVATPAEPDVGYADIRLDHGQRPKDVTDEEVLYPGYPCDEDDACSTGLCYGSATLQGVFEPAECQTSCLGLNDFNHYCNSHTDCCSGRCCLDCGPKRGLCVLNAPTPSE